MAVCMFWLTANTQRPTITASYKEVVQETVLYCSRLVQKHYGVSRPQEIKIDWVSSWELHLIGVSVHLWSDLWITWAEDHWILSRIR